MGKMLAVRTDLYYTLKNPKVSTSCTWQKFAQNIVYLCSISFAATEIFGEMDASSKTVRRKIPYKITYKGDDMMRGKWSVEIECKSVQVKGYEDARMKATANCDGLQVTFGRAGKYQVNASGQIEDQGKCLRLQAQWTEVTTVATRTTCNSLHCVLLLLLFRLSFKKVLFSFPVFTLVYLVSGYRYYTAGLMLRWTNIPSGGE